MSTTGSIVMQKRAIFQLRDIFQHPATLLGAVLLGGWMGILFPAGVSALSAISTLYLSLIQMASLPFVVLAIFFGLQRLPSLPGSGRRLLLMIVMSAAAMLLCAVIGLLVASATSAGAGMTDNETAALGGLALQSESQFTMSLHDTGASAKDSWKVSALVPDNLFAVLALGSVPSILIGVVLFGIAVAVQGQGASGHLTNIFEGIYRALESLINRFNALLPAAAFVLAAAATSAAGVEVIVLLKSFLGAFFASALLICALSVGAIAWRVKKSPWEVLLALREPVTVCLFSPVAVAAVPGFIHSMSVRLGFSRGLVELYSPIAPVFVKAGEALFFAVLAFFIANVYGHPLSIGDTALICLLSWLAALWSVGFAGVKSVVLGTFVMNSLGLPLEALLPVFILVEGICEGARNLLSFLVSSALLALVSDGLYLNEGQFSEAGPSSSITFAIGRMQALFGLILLAIALLSVFCAGVGFGLRKAIAFAI
jgi:Na+/H+-dicarboxylate symporter